MKRKSRILLIPNVAWWIIGEMGKQIMASFGDEYVFYFVPEGILERRPGLLASMIPSVDAIHCLNESSIELFRNHDPATLPPIATWIHHVTSWSAQHQLAVERSAALTVCTEPWKREIEDRCGPGLSVTVVPHGVDTNFFRKEKPSRTKFGIPPDRFVVGFIGNRGSDNDAGRKGVDVLLNVIERVAGHLPNLHVVLGGPGWQSEAEDLKRRGLSASATGYIPKADLPSLYSALDVYLLTSRVEGGPCTVFEAMACETVVVSTRVGAVPELIVDRVNGFSTEIDDIEGLVERILTTAESPRLRAELAIRARSTVEKLTWQTTLRTLAPVYERLTRSSTRNPDDAGPSWMADSAKLFFASSAADALASVVSRVRTGKLSPAAALPALTKMVDRTSFADFVRGAAMLRGIMYKPDRRSFVQSSASLSNAHSKHRQGGGA